MQSSRSISGTLELVVLEVISRGRTYGYQIAQDVLAASRGYFDIKEGSLYPALHRLERQGFLTATWQPADEARRRKYYQLSPAGEQELQRRRDEWRQFRGAVESVMGGGGQGTSAPSDGGGA